MTALDIIVILLVGLGLFTGVRRGLVYLILSLAVWLLIVLALWAFHGPLGNALIGVVGTESGAYVLAFAIIFAFIFLAGKYIAGRAARSVRNSRVGSLDRLLGAGFGALKGLVYATLFYMTFSFGYDTIWGRNAARPNWIANAVTYPLIFGTANTFVDLAGEQRRGAETGSAAPISK